MVTRNLIGLFAAMVLASACQSTNSAVVSDELDVQEEIYTSEDDDFQVEEVAVESDTYAPDAGSVAIAAPSAMNLESDTKLLPQNATAGQCFARTLVPGKYETKTKRVLMSEGREVASVIPAKYKWIKKQILIKPESTKLVHMPAQYASVSERILKRPAYTTWKKGKSNKVSSVNNGSAGATGEVLCKVEVPAEYSVVKKRVLKSKASTREISIPAQYKTVSVQELAEDSRVVTKTIPEKYRTITSRTLVEQPYVKWDQVLCETNATPKKVAQIQSALKKAGYLKGPADGILGTNTLKAVKGYQLSKNLPTGGLTLDTAKSLGVTF